MTSPNTSQLKLSCLAVVAFIVFVTPNTTKADNLVAVTGTGPGHAPIVKVTIATGAGTSTVSFSAYPPTFQGGVRVAVGDVNGDGMADIITAPGPGFTSLIKVFDGRSLRRNHVTVLSNVNPYSGLFRGGVFVAAGDVNGDGRADIIVAPGTGVPLVRVFDGLTGEFLMSFLAYSPLFTGGVTVGAGDVNDDGHADIITGPGPGAGPNVRVFDGLTQTMLQSFFAYDPAFTGGVFVAAGDINADAHADVITGAGAGAGPHVKVFDGVSNQELKSFFAYTPSFTGGVRVAAGDVNGDNVVEIITGAGPGAGPHVKVFDATNLNELYSFFAFEPNYMGGVFVAGEPVRRRGR